MLTADLVMARQRSGKLHVPPLSEALRARALDFAEAYLRFAKAHVGRPREALLETCRQMVLAPGERKLAQGLLKLVLDRAVFREETTLEPAAVRRALFEAATLARRQATTAAGLREEVMARIATEMSTTPEALEQALYADLPAAHILEAAPPLNAERLVQGYEMAQWQAVLLRAVQVRAQVFCSSPEALRALFRKLKFLGLSHRTTVINGPRGRVGHELTLDGPFSLFESVTRYGLALGLALPSLAACDVWSLEADLRWGPERTPLSFSLAGKGSATWDEGVEPPMRDEVAQLLARLREKENDQDRDQDRDKDSVKHKDKAMRGEWEVTLAQDVWELPGVGVCVPDLALLHRPSGHRVLVEVLGFWSREAVFKRLDLVRAGLSVPVVFVVSRHLRVSEGLLDDVEHAALYVYARVIAVEALLARAASVLAAWKGPAPAPASASSQASPASQAEAVVAAGPSSKAKNKSHAKRGVPKEKVGVSAAASIPSRDDRPHPRPR